MAQNIICAVVAIVAFFACEIRASPTDESAGWPLSGDPLQRFFVDRASNSEHTAPLVPAGAAPHIVLIEQSSGSSLAAAAAPSGADEDDSEKPVPLRLALAEEGNSSASSIDASFDDEFGEDDIAEVMKEVTQSRDTPATTTTPPPPPRAATLPLQHHGKFGGLPAALAAARLSAAAAAVPPALPAVTAVPHAVSAAAAKASHGKPALRKLKAPRHLPAAAAVPHTLLATVPHAALAVAADRQSQAPQLRGQKAAETNASSFPDLMILGSSSMEDQLTDLFKLGPMRQSMSKAAFEATPFGKSITKINHLTSQIMMPKLLAAHESNQKLLMKLASDVRKCGGNKKDAVGRADVEKTSYLRLSPLHKTCRAGEGGLASEKITCREELKDKLKIRDLKCKDFSMVKKKYGDQQMNRQIANKAGSESVESYVTRLTNTVCGSMTCAEKRSKGMSCGHGGMKDIFDQSKRECERVTKEFNNQFKKCRRVNKEYAEKVKECDSLQDQMDGSACKRAMQMKDACEAYAECHFAKRAAYLSSQKMILKEAADRKVEWRGLQRMQCLVSAFTDGSVKIQEVEACKKKTHSTTHLNIKLQVLPPLVKCSVPNLYPATPSYKKREFAPLPILAKGRDDANQCTGVQEIPTKPMKGSPEMCKCQRVTLNGPYSGGPLVKCTNCWDVSMSTQMNSCPEGTKIFSPRSQSDWKTIIASATPVRAPHWIVDITRPQDGCTPICGKKPMNSHVDEQKTWVTSDRSPWWLRSTPYREPDGNYLANCYMAILHAKSPNKITMKDDKCNIHSHSYFCQNKEVSLTPKKGSPRSCTCKQVVLTGKYSAGALLKCAGCLSVSKSLQKNSCPTGTKLFSPRSRGDWATFIASAKPLRNPHFIIDVTRPQNGCGGCTRNAMNSHVRAQATWRTSDMSPWWLRSSKYSEPSGDYKANCYMDLWQSPPNEDSVVFNDKKCKYHSHSYYCQTAKVKKKRVALVAPSPPPPSPPPPARPPKPKRGGSYTGFKCAAVGKYTGFSKNCGAWKPLTKSQCWSKCKRSAPAKDKKSCNKIHGIPDCVAMVWDARKKTCNLYRSCTKLVKAHASEHAKIKDTYKPAATVFLKKKNAKCSGKPYTEGAQGCEAPGGLTEKQCSALCYGNRYVGKNCPIKKCVAAAFHKKDGRCELYDKCPAVSRAVGVTALKKVR